MRYNTRIYAHITSMLGVKSLTHVIRAYYAYDTRKWSTNTQLGVYIQNMKALGLVVLEKKICLCFSHDTPGARPVWTPGAR